jgi:hypothetical protein
MTPHGRAGCRKTTCRGAFGLALLSLLIVTVPAVATAGEGDEAPETGINLVIQVVDDLWLPLHDASVTVSAQTRRAETYRAMTDDEGYARFSVPFNVRYSIRVALWGYKEERIRSVRAWGNQKVYAQVKLRE